MFASKSKGLLLAVRILLTAFLLSAISLSAISLYATEPVGARYTIQLKTADDSVVTLAEIISYAEGSWSYSLENDLVKGSFYFGNLPPPPDPKAERFAMFEVTKDNGVTGARGVFWRFPAGATILVLKDGTLVAEATFKHNPESS